MTNIIQFPIKKGHKITTRNLNANVIELKQCEIRMLQLQKSMRELWELLVEAQKGVESIHNNIKKIQKLYNTEILNLGSEIGHGNIPMKYTSYATNIRYVWDAKTGEFVAHVTADQDPKETA